MTSIIPQNMVFAAAVSGRGLVLPVGFRGLEGVSGYKYRLIIGLKHNQKRKSSPRHRSAHVGWTNESPSSLGERSNVRKTNRVAWGKVLEWVTKASLFRPCSLLGSRCPSEFSQKFGRGVATCLEEKVVRGLKPRANLACWLAPTCSTGGLNRPR
jgi:hypothetical protein